ncbi:hypothetical protein BVC80_831g2 [Macleaya cordata]|uniref:Uncharacterized protein n=1 Tax=Macleaya cordata TaxID=56857 RepID=A0A200QF96_MACCD|nr:hypothetical protein BVC80_831g2 [Macleaya cordata]
MVVEDSWSPPTRTTTIDGVAVTKPKARSIWTEDEIDKATYNNKGLNAIFNAITVHEFRSISNCLVAKEAWTKLEVTHEGNRTVKIVKL